MGKLKTITMAVVLAAGAAALATAGPGGRGANSAERVKARVEKMRENLALTDDQARRIESILTQAAAEHQAARGTEATDREERRERMREQRRATTEKIRAVLNDEQRAKLQQMHDERKRSHRKSGGGEREERF